MATITPNQDFLHGQTRYKKSTEYDVDDGLAMYFTLNGWTTDSEGATPENIDLDIHDLTQDTEVK